MSKPATKTEGAFSGLDPALAIDVQQLIERIQNGKEVHREFIIQQYAEHGRLLLELLPTIQTLAELNRDERSARTVGFRHREALGDFEILREIGRGGMGVVYEARQKSLDRRVAVKILPFAAILDERQLMRFKNEARAAAMLKHPNIVGVHAVGCERGVHFYAMEFIDGVSLDKLIESVHRDKSKSIRGQSAAGLIDNQSVHTDAASAQPADTSSKKTDIETAPFAAISTAFSSDRKLFYGNVARLGIQGAEALHYAHQQGIVHRDIKPPNILLDRDGNLHVADFGLARIHSNEELTRTGDVIGTLRYMSPEQIDGSRVVDQRTDVYGLGLTLYELVTGKAAIDDGNRKELLSRIIEGEIPTPSQFDRQIPKDLETIIQKATHRDADCRFSSARELADDLRRFYAGRPILSRPVTQRERLRRWIGRNPRIAALLVIVFCLMFALSVGGPWMAVRQRQVAREKTELARVLELQLYDTNITSAAALVEKGDFAQADELLRPYESSPFTGF